MRCSIINPVISTNTQDLAMVHLTNGSNSRHLIFLRNSCRRVGQYVLFACPIWENHPSRCGRLLVAAVTTTMATRRRAWFPSSTGTIRLHKIPRSINTSISNYLKMWYLGSPFTPLNHLLLGLGPFLGSIIVILAFNFKHVKKDHQISIHHWNAKSKIIVAVNRKKDKLQKIWTGRIKLT